jgi:poly(3-hydroxybutyrate) depolymerase
LVEKALIEYSGLNEWAVNNQLIILYPQAKYHLRKNPIGCWNYGNYQKGGSNELDYTNRGVQPLAIKAMAERMTESRWSDFDFLANNYNENSDFTKWMLRMYNQSKLGWFILYFILSIPGWYLR